MNFLAIDLSRAVEFMEIGRVTEAMAACRQLLVNLSEQGKVLNQLGCEAFQAGRLADAAALLKCAVAQHPRESRIHQNLAITLDAQGLHAEAQAVRSALTQPPFFTVPVHIQSDLNVWGTASGYEVRVIRQQPFAVPDAAKFLPEVIHQFAQKMADESHKPAYAICADDMRFLFWHWKLGDSNPVVIPISKTNDIVFTHWLRYFPFIHNWTPDSNECIIDVTQFNPVRIQVKGECFFMGSYNVYGHWISDHLPTIQAISDAELPDGIPIIANGINEWQRDILTYMGYINQLVDLEISKSQCTIVEFDRIWLAGGFSMKTRYDFLRSTFARGLSLNNKKEINNLPSRIYIARKLSRDRVFNAEEIRSYVEQRGFSIVYGEDLNTKKKAEIFGQAKIMISEQGSGGINYHAFAHQDCILVMLMASPMIETPSESDLMGGWIYNIPFLDKIICAIGQPTVGVKDCPADAISSVYPIKIIEKAIDQAEELIQKC